MYFRQFYLGCLAQASYLLGSGGVGVVVDPQRDVDVYLEEAHREALRIAHVILTHVHADFVSGHNELAARAGATIHIGARAHATFPHIAIADGDALSFGRCTLTFLETPGHTPESVCILVTDWDRSPDPFAVLTGDTLFVGDVGRPDLAADRAPEELASDLYVSLHDKVLVLADDVEVYPAHGPGSLCGRQMGEERSSTIGRERASNPALRAASREEFVALLTAGAREKPAYFMQDASINRRGARPLADLGPLVELSPEDALERQRDGAVVLDTRDEEAFGASHVANAVNIGLDGQYASWAATLVGLEAELVIVAEDAARADESRTRLARVGMEHVAGVLAGGITAWRDAGYPTQSVPQIDVRELPGRLAEEPDVQLVDVRRPAEWESGHIPGARFMPLDRLTSSLDTLQSDRPVTVYCKSGYRSSIAASLLQRAAFGDVTNVRGGYDAWRSLQQGE